MELTPADARAAPSASGPTDMATETPPSPKRPRDPSSDNKVSQRATSFDPVWPERQIVTTRNQPTAPASACQSLAHPTTPMGRWLKSVDCWVLLCEGLQSRSTTTQKAERLRRADITVSHDADLLCRQLQPTLPRGTLGTASRSSLRQSPRHTTTAHRPGVSITPQQTVRDPSSESKRQTAHRPPHLHHRLPQRHVSVFISSSCESESDSLPAAARTSAREASLRGDGSRRTLGRLGCTELACLRR
eukprot:scaffold12418_cov127-Isochrysis_galbana.AAC.2